MEKKSGKNNISTFNAVSGTTMKYLDIPALIDGQPTV